MKRYTLTSLILLLLITMAFPALAQEAITPGSTVEGEYSGEAVQYTLEASAGQLVIASMESEVFNTLLTISQGEDELASDQRSGPNNNALLAYVVQEDGTYTLSADASFFSDDVGAYTLTVDVVDPVVATIDEPVTLEPDAEGSHQLYTVFEGTEGMVVNVWSSATGEEEDTTVSLTGPDAVEIETDDDDGAGDDALLRRVVLPADGLYLIKAETSRSDEPLLEAVEVTIEATEQLYLSAEPQEMILGDGEGQHGTEVFTVDVTAGTTYRFIFTIEHMPDEDPGIRLELLDTERFFTPTLDTRHTTRVAWDFVPNASGTIRLDVHPNLFSRDLQSITYTAALEVIEE